MLGHATIEVARDADIQRTREVRHDVDIVFSSWHQSSGVGPRILRFAQDDNRAEGPLVSMTEVTSNRAQKLRAHPAAGPDARRAPGRVTNASQPRLLNRQSIHSLANLPVARRSGGSAAGSLGIPGGARGSKHAHHRSAHA